MILYQLVWAAIAALGLWSEPALVRTEHTDPAATLEAAPNLAARGERLAAFDGRCIPGGCVTPPSNTPGILGRPPPFATEIEVRELRRDLAEALAEAGRALPAGRLTRLGETPHFHHGLPASPAHGQPGQEEAAIRSAAMALNARFQQVDSVREYTEVRDEAKRLQARAAGLGLVDLAYGCAVLSADAAFFRSSAKDVPATERDHPLAALEDLLVAFPLQRYTTERISSHRLVSLTAATVSAAMGQYFLDHDKILVALKALAPLVEQSIPSDFDYGDPTVGNLRKAISTASNLAALSYRYGSPAIASSRLAIAEQRAKLLGDTELVISLISSHYAGERSARAAPAQLSRLRDEAWQRAQDLRNAYRSATGRIWAAYRSDELFGVMLQDELEDPTDAAAKVLARVESLKARMLLERLSTPGITELRTAQALALEDKVLSFEKPKQIDASLIGAEMRLASQLSSFEMGRSDVDQSRSQSLRFLEDLYRGAGAGYRATAATVTLAALQQTLASDEALIEYVIPPIPLHPAPHLWILLITRNLVQTAHVALDEALGGGASFTGRMAIDGRAPVDASALGNLVITTRTDIRTSDDRAARRGLAALYQLLIGPLEAQGFRPESFKRLVIVPHGTLHYVPFAALLDAGGRFLIAKTEIVVTPSASAWHLLSQRQRKAGPLVAFANPDLGSRGLASLPFADQEGAAIVKLMPPGSARIFRAADAARKNLFAEGPGAAILHLATHGDFPDDNAANAHALWLADEGGKSVAVNASDVRGLSLAAARLVVLSVCNGGLYRIGPSDEPYGLLSAFLEAGAPNVLGTLWPLDDQFGRDFMIEFYRQLPTHGAAGALRQASLRFIGEEEFLRRWAAFVLVGSGRLD